MYIKDEIRYSKYIQNIRFRYYRIIYSDELDEKVSNEFLFFLEAEEKLSQLYYKKGKDFSAELIESIGKRRLEKLL